MFLNLSNRARNRRLDEVNPLMWFEKLTNEIHRQEHAIRLAIELLRR